MNEWKLLRGAVRNDETPQKLSIALDPTQKCLAETGAVYPMPAKIVFISNILFHSPLRTTKGPGKASFQIQTSFSNFLSDLQVAKKKTCMCVDALCILNEYLWSE